MSAGDAGTGPACEDPGSITTVHRYELPLPREDVWTLISEVSRYRLWWPWLRALEAAALAEGEAWRCEVRPPVPYAVRFHVVIERIEVPGPVCANISGDMVGHATLQLDEGVLGARPRSGPRSRPRTRRCR